MRDGDVPTIDYPNRSGITFSRLLLTMLNDVVWHAPANSYEATKREIEAIRRGRANHWLQRTRGLGG
jgi:hypothetical protein